ncbi:MAG TPA: hypothetical protein VNM90_15660, partial [Haliangium sp.]|nr:hypothetical protein [Haliangium sp.]
PAPAPAPEPEHEYDYAPEFGDDSEITLAREAPEDEAVTENGSRRGSVLRAADAPDHDSDHALGSGAEDYEAEEQTQVRRSPDVMARREEGPGGPEGSTA